MPSQIVNPPGGGGSGYATDINGIPIASDTPEELQALVVINGQYAPRNIPGLTPLPDVDVAFGRPATASSTYTNVGGVAPGNAFDSNPGTEWAAAEHSTAPHWLRVDLQASHTITSWHFEGYNDGSGSQAIMRDFQLQYLDEADNTTWQIADIISGNSELNSFTHTIAESASRYWRVYITQGTQLGADGIARISQVKLFEKYVEPVPQRQATESQMGSVFLRDDLGGSASHPRVAAIHNIPISATGPDGTNNTFTYDPDSDTIKWLPGVGSLTPNDTSGSDLAAGRPVTFSSAYNQSGFYNPGDLAVDGNDGTQWATTPGASYPHILTVDLGSVKVINKWRVKGFSDGSGDLAVLNNYQCQYLDVDDGVTWHTADEVSGNTARETAAVFSPASGRYWRLYITACTSNGDNIARVSTFSLFERIPAGGLLKINGIYTDGTLPSSLNNTFKYNPATNRISWLPDLQGQDDMAAWTTPVSTDFAWGNQDGTVLDTLGGGFTITKQPAGSTAISARLKAAPTAPYSLKVFVKPHLMPVNFIKAGIGWRDSTTGKIVTMAFLWDGGPAMGLGRFNSLTSWDDWELKSGSQHIFSPAGIWLRLRDDATNLYVDFSEDGFHWYNYVSRSRTFWTPNPDQLLAFVGPENGSYEASIKVLSWKEGAIDDV